MTSIQYIYNNNNTRVNVLKRTLDSLSAAPNVSQSFETLQPNQKRPRRVTTPNSALSFVTQEEEDTSYHHYSPQSSSSYLSTPSPQYVSHPSTDPTNRTDEEIEADVENSFATGRTLWTNETLIQVLANEIEDMCLKNNQYQVTIPNQFHNFYSQCKQPFDLEFYIRRLVQYSNCSTAAFVVMFVYIQRLQQSCKHLLVTDMNCHRLIATALVLAIKYLDDEVFSNTYYARVVGVTGKELNDLELKMLKALDFKLVVSPDIYTRFEDHLIQTAQLILTNSLPSSPVP